jgi:NAD(P)-dependent dehydrogenase (short-subunit alcohol dehydrogenase family)
MPAEQRTALVTGGNGGLGAAIARALHDAGHTVLVVHSPGNASIGAWLEAQAGEGYTSSPTARMWPTMPPARSWPASFKQTVTTSTFWSTTRASRVMLRSAS